MSTPAVRFPDTAKSVFGFTTLRGRFFPASTMYLNIDTHLYVNFGENCFCRLKNAKTRSRESCLFGQSQSVCANFGRSEKCSAHELPAQVDDLLQAKLVVESEKRPFRRGASQQSFDEGVKSFVRSGDGFLQTRIQLLAQNSEKNGVASVEIRTVRRDGLHGFPFHLRPDALCLLCILRPVVVLVNSHRAAVAPELAVSEKNHQPKVGDFLDGSFFCVFRAWPVSLTGGEETKIVKITNQPTWLKRIWWFKSL